MTETELKNLLKTVAPPDEAARAAAHAHWAALAKPVCSATALMESSVVSSSFWAASMRRPLM